MIYLIRHAEAEGNLYRISQGQYDSAVTDFGYRQIAALAARFAPVAIDAVYSSDLYRTCATAQAICGPKGLPLHKCRDLREICVGDWEQKPWGEIARDEPREMEYFLHRLDLWHIPGAETPEAVRDRMLRALRAIAAENPGKTVAVFSHGSAIRILLAALQGYSVAEIGKTPHGCNTAVSLLEAEGPSLRVIFRDDGSHLDGAPGTLSRRHPNALEPGLCFSPVLRPEQAEFVRSCALHAHLDGGDPAEPVSAEPADRGRTLIAELNGRSAGVLRMESDIQAAQGRGWITLYCMERAFRGRGYGVQLLGQAVQYYRPLGRQALCLALSGDNQPAARFFTACGFTAGEERTADGRTVWCKDIGFRPLP
jgi:probable phosphoglycerate mutase